MALLYLSGCGALSVHLSYINVVEVRQRKHLPRGAEVDEATRHDEDALNRISTMPSPKINAEVRSEYSVARHGSLLRWGLLPPYPRIECPPGTQSLAKARSLVGGYCPHTPE